MSWYKLIIEALNNSSNGMLLVSDIYKAISAKHPYYKMETKYWKRSIPTYLSKCKIFVKEGDTKYWKLDQQELKKTPWMKKLISYYKCPLCFEAGIQFIGADAIELSGTYLEKLQGRLAVRTAKKKSQPRNWFGEQGMSEGSE